MMFYRFVLILFFTLLSACQPATQQAESSVQPSDLAALYQTQNVKWYQPRRALSDFSLMTHQSQPFTKQQLADQWTLLFLGYTFCPDICPTTLMDLSRIYPLLKQSQIDIKVVLVSADPDRDTKARLAQYIHFFNKEFVAATGPHQQLFPFTRQLDLIYSMGNTNDVNNPDYLVNHSASIVLISPEAELVASFKPDTTSMPPTIDYAQIAKVVKQLTNPN